MTKNTKILIIIGAAMLVTFSSILIYSYLNEPEHIQQEYPITQNGNEADDGGETVGITEDIHIAPDSGTTSETTQGDEEYDLEELTGFALEAIQTIEITDTLQEPSENSFYQLALLNDYYFNLLGNQLAEEEEVENNADWVARELTAWMNVADETSGFSYSESEFLSYVEQEGYISGEDLRTRTLLNELQLTDHSLYVRGLEIRYLKSYIWNEVKGNFERSNPQQGNESEEDYQFRLYLLFEDEITTYLVENYPELLQE
ncbi:hypothetical protein [Evansella tamaricis]|uniref:Uncharacterized protein n=1 Tax=Evansella tamaricis TaxID=2069301 RepID=A0ABS6JJF7_9BACI|nr:hypothetical protein [Evansella tamaricis]MBU9713781.1 hypothetical protein [Evansella tamaricis]